MKRRSAHRWFPCLASFVVACATQGGSGGRSGSSEKVETVKKARACDSFAHPCATDEACIDGTCRPRGCSTDGECGDNAACIEGWCIVRQCKESLGCLGEDQTAGTEDDRSCVGGVCLPMSCPRDGNRCPAPGKERCSWNSDCGFGRVCFNASCVSARCAQNKDCLPQLCHTGLCYEEQCNDRKRCRGGQTCVNGLCLATSASASAN
jgi:hypothetical protein